MTSSVQVPFPIFTEKDGMPLENGYIYIGSAGLNPEVASNQLTIYWDEALTIPAAQPLRTLGGYIYRSGTPANVYVDSDDYSVTVRNKNGGIVYSALSAKKLISLTSLSDLDQINSITNTTDYATLGANICSPISLTHSTGSIGTTSTNVTINAYSYYLVKIDITTTNNGYVKVLFDGNDVFYGDQPSGLYFSTATILNNAIENNRTVSNNEYYFMLGTSATSYSTINIETDILWGGSIASIEVYEVTPKEFGLEITASDGEGKDNPTGVKGGAYNRGDLALGDKFTLGAFQYDGLSPTPAFNVAVGIRALGALFKGDQNTAIGSLALQSNEGSNNTAVGYSALKLNNKGQENTAVGYKAGTSITTGYRNTLGGFWAGVRFKTGVGNTVFGWQNNTAGIDKSFRTDIGYNAGHGFDGSSSVFVGANSGLSTSGQEDISIGTVTAVGAETKPVGDGAVTIGYQAKVGVEATQADYAIAIGQGAHARGSKALALGYNATTSNTSACIAIGDTAAADTDAGIAIGDGATVAGGSRSVALGESSSATGNQSVALGPLSTPTGANTAAVGFRALNNYTGSANSALGHTAGLQAAVAYTNCTLLGSLTTVTGSNQVQLGDSATTTYAYGAVQNRSDERDKLDISDLTDAHIAFFMDVEWKQFRFNYRESYIDIDNDTGERIEQENDGSRSGKRLHVGAIAQQVEQAMKKHNIDFAGLQHHSLNGGEDIYSIGYQEFIAIQGEVIQRQQRLIDNILLRLDEAGI